MAKRRARLHSKEAVMSLDGDVTNSQQPGRSLGTQWISDNLLEYTRRVWSKQYGRPITADEAIEICVNVKRFAELLVEIKGENEARAKVEGNSTVSGDSNSE